MKKAIIIIIIFSLLILNVLIFTGTFSQKRDCFRDMCIYGNESPTDEFKAMIDDADRIILVVEGDKTATQTTAYVDQAFAQFTTDMIRLNKTPLLVAFALVNRQKVECHVEDYVNGSFTTLNRTVEQCESINPLPNEVKIVLKYPAYLKNKIYLDRNEIEIQSNSGASLVGMVTVLRGLF